MITHHYSSTGARPLEQIKGLKIIDVGGANSFADGYLDAIVDMRIPQATAKNVFTGNMDYPDLWEKVLAHVKIHGKWDYCICTHTLEDINNPVYVSSILEKIAKKGILIFPSKYRELSRFSGNFRGFIHHRWIFDVRDGKLVALPKINYIEDSYFDRATDLLPANEEIIIEWEGSIDMVNGMLSMETEESIKQLYKDLI
jgi:hypothetical protein